MNLATITTRGRMTIPKAIRRAAQLNEGDVIALEIASDHLIVRKVVTGSDKYSCAMQETLGEWTSPEDEEAWGDL